jgi:hypothetical protein
MISRAVILGRFCDSRGCFYGKAPERASATNASTCDPSPILPLIGESALRAIAPGRPRNDASQVMGTRHFEQVFAVVDPTSGYKRGGSFVHLTAGGGER